MLFVRTRTRTRLFEINCTRTRTRCFENSVYSYSYFTRSLCACTRTRTRHFKIECTRTLLVLAILKLIVLVLVLAHGRIRDIPGLNFVPVILTGL